MKNWYSLIILIYLFTTFFTGCQSPEKTPYWIESENRFYTKDINKAQKEISFIIILPTYLPENNKNNLPEIEGPLKRFQDNDEIEIIIRYGINIGKNYPGAIVIYERNYGYSMGEITLDHEEELIEIEGISVIRTKEEWSEFDAYYSFNSKSIYYKVEIHGIPNEESYKIVESIIGQLKSE